MDERLKEIKEEYVSYSDIATNKNSKVLEDIHYLIAFIEIKINQLEKENQSLQYKVEVYEKALKNSQKDFFLNEVRRVARLLDLDLSENEIEELYNLALRGGDSMLQTKLISDLGNYHKYGLKYALELISKDYICKKCGKKHQNTKDVGYCC